MSKPIQTKFKTQADLVTPMSLTLTIGTDGRDIEDNIQLLGCYFKAATAITETVTVTVVSAEGAGYSYLLDSTSLSSATTALHYCRIQRFWWRTRDLSWYWSKLYSRTWSRDCCSDAFYWR